ncbi:MAG: hypothetical protein FJ104_00840, partial [Deltaproteobacteria bacterium]|nr:hypothetical protein [Deltaproteobacteria bacterium]
MRTRRILSRSVVALAALTAATNARAQADTVSTSPNVLLLVDTSGSMELKSSSDQPPVCVPDTPNVPPGTVGNEKSRWIELLEVLTGTVRDYSCYAQDRASAEFRDEYRLGPTNLELPYDYGLEYRYHRPMSNRCAPGPGDVPWFDVTQTPYDFQGTGKSALKFHPFSAGVGIDTTSACTGFAQVPDGLLDSWEGLIRFGLMTFDTHQDSGTGLNGAGVFDPANGLAGTWSYYSANSRCQRPDLAGTTCRTGTLPNPVGCCSGTPWDCSTAGEWEVGARNGAAPPWEGRMVSFGPSATDGKQRKDWIEAVLLGTRPYGATPIAGLLSDARDFLWYDTAADPIHAKIGDPYLGTTLGPYAQGAGDPLVNSSCRDNYVILLTDGEPNLDLRPACVNGGDDSACPFQLPETIVDELANTSDPNKPKVRTFVVGFSIGQATTAGGPVPCESMSAADIATTCAAPPDPQTAACCVLNNIAFYGTPTDLRDADDTSPPGCTVGVDPGCHLASRAFFPSNPAELRSALSTIFANLTRRATGRTFPVTANAPATDPSSKGYEFASGANPAAGRLWSGVLTRRKIICDATATPVVQPVRPDEGDDFIANVNRFPNNRTILTVEADISGTVRHATRSIRPFVDVTDGAGNYGGSVVPFDSSNVTPESLDMASASWCASPLATCRNQVVDWAAGRTSATPVSRCQSPGDADCSVIGDIFHSVPAVRPGRPSDFLRDTTYATFAGGLAQRDTMLYTSSNDGFLHGFLVAPGVPTDPQVDGSFNNERWAFVPPAVLPSFPVMYPLSAGSVNRIPALDGAPVIRDVVATQGGSRALATSGCSGGTTACYPFRLERKSAPNVSAGESHTWRTVMVQGFGSGRGGYFALDVTKPRIVAGDANTGPKFLWQLTTNEAGNQMFGKGSVTPLITTLYLDLRRTGLGGGFTEPLREVPVAVLPGGYGDPVQASPPDCANPGAPLDVPGYPPRTKVRCWPDNPASPSTKNSTAARTLTIVRLDTGQVIRRFQPYGVTQPAALGAGFVIDRTRSKLGTDVPLDIPAPIVGQPVAYPSQAGQVADRIFVGDAEGRMWRIDVSNPDPDKWTMNVFFDAYHGQGGGLPVAQPIETPPVLSVDDQGSITVAFATGDQNNLAPDLPSPAPASKNYVVSLREQLPSSGVATDGTRKYFTRLNWSQEFTGGERVTGPLTLFNRALYFSTYLEVPSANCTAPGVSRVLGLDY